MTLGRSRPTRPRSRQEAERLGVRMVMQELSLVPTLSVAENLLQGRRAEPLRLHPARRAQRSGRTRRWR